MFRFKQFSIDDELCAMKIGTDGVLLGAWADVDGSSCILDLGTGTGLIALMLAQRNAHARITAVDIDSGAVIQAGRNFERSPWSERLDVAECDVRDFGSMSSFDHIVSNPPYFVESVESPDKARAVARHASHLQYGDIVAKAERLLMDGGRLSVILPTECAMRFRFAAFERLWLRRQTDVITKLGARPKRTMMEFVKCPVPLMPRCSEILMGGDEYRKLVDDFYLEL